MALEGNLKDISLPNIMQILCLEQRKVELQLKRQDERGFIQFDRGEVVHATADALEGEEAVFYLLSWGDGDFRTNNQMIITRRTVNMRWDQLLMEGMRRLDELERDRAAAAAAAAASSVTTQSRVVTQADAERDSRLENEVLMLLSRLEQLQTRMLDKNARRKPAPALETLALMANQLVEVMEKALDQGASAESLKNVLAKFSVQHPSAQLLHPEHNRLSSREVVEIYDSASSSKREQVFDDLSLGIMGVMDSYFSLIMSCFRSKSVSDELKEAYYLFLTDLTQAVTRINTH